MFCMRVVKQLINCPLNKTLLIRNVHVANKIFKAHQNKEVAIYKSFESVEEKNKSTYLEMVEIFINRDRLHRRGHVEFIYAALKNMETFNVHKDLEVYKALIDVLPKGKFIPQNIFQSEFMHYPKQQQCAVDLLEQMEDNGVMPDSEMEQMLLNIFGNRGFPLRKYWRMMYWMPKFKNLSPWPLPDPVPNDIFELAKLAISRISSVDLQSKVTIYETAHIKDSIDETWIVSAQSPTQKDLLKQHDVEKPIYVEGPSRIWIKDKLVNYFILRANTRKTEDETVIDEDDVSSINFASYNMNMPATVQKVIPSVHEQSDGTIFAVCATGTSSKDSLLSWIRHLELDGNGELSQLTIVFTLKSGTKEVAKVSDEKLVDKGEV